MMMLMRCFSRRCAALLIFAAADDADATRFFCADADAAPMLSLR